MSPKSTSNSFSSFVKLSLNNANLWFRKTPERALEEAYRAGLAIKSIEDTHFGGNRISSTYGNYGESVQTYFQSELKKNLKTIQVRLTEFRTSKSLLQISSRPITEIQFSDDNTTDLDQINVIDKEALILKKLKFLDDVLNRYGLGKPPQPSLVIPATSMTLAENGASPDQRKSRSSIESSRAIASKPSPKSSHAQRADESADSIESIVDKTGVLPRSILKTVDRIKRELDPGAEEEVVESFRNSKARTIISLRLILLLIIVPLLTQQLTKIAIVGPIVDQMRSGEQVEIFLNTEMEEDALEELRMYEERLKFQALIGLEESLTEEEIQTRLRERAEEIQEEYKESSNDAVKNVFSDLFSVFAFVGLILASQREIAVLKSFIDELIYGLSDSAKAFIIILLTDTFVGFHSPHGWEVLLEGISRHLGLPANRDFIFLFIATFPVILDTIFKYWIFRYLNRISPSAVATYRTMNE